MFSSNNSNNLGSGTNSTSGSIMDSITSKLSEATTKLSDMKNSVLGSSTASPNVGTANMGSANNSSAFGSNTNTGSAPFMDFSLSKYTDFTNEFLESNSLVAKAAFLLLVVFVFFMLLKLISGFMVYFFNRANENPTKLLDGMINANEAFVFKQSTKDLSNKTIYRSVNEDKGIEFSWSVYLFIQDLNDSSKNTYHVFNKGDQSGNVNNAPGLYIDNSTNSLKVKMNTFSTIDETITVSNIPRNKWINVVIRCQSRKIDVYVNGLIAQSLELSSVPKQNYGNVFVAQNGGFSGFISNLWYYNYALSIGEIQRLNNYGPSLKLMHNTGKYDNKYPEDYLSLRWYFGNAGDQYISP